MIQYQILQNNITRTVWEIIRRLTNKILRVRGLKGSQARDILYALSILVTLQLLTISSYVSMRSSRYEAQGKFGEHESCVRVARGVAKSNSSFLSALQTSQVLHISMNTQLTYEPIVL